MRVQVAGRLLYRGKHDACVCVCVCVCVSVSMCRFSCWLELAVMELATETAPWYRQKVESKQSSLQELVCPDTEYDVGRFKKLFKVRCMPCHMMLCHAGLT